MNKLKVLNLYAGIGGNRKLWEDVDVTAVEIDADIANIYKDYFPDDKVVVMDAHQYLLDHYKEYDFIWASPPCQSHTSLRKNFAFSNDKGRVRPPIYPDMKLYQEIIFLDNFFKGLFVVENVKPYYEPLIKAKEVERHLFWANFKIGSYLINGKHKIIGSNMNEMQLSTGFNLSKFKLKHRKDTLLRNCVQPELGLYILNCARNIITKSNIEQTELF